ncbi:MAG TPA: hypothetical protein VGH44_05555 [Candidatus Saccharimonadia bacterium]
MTQYKESANWQAAINIGPKLIALADDMPASEQMGLGMQLRQIMVDLPATVADDLLHGGNTRHLQALKLVAALELIDRVYPALDTASAKTAADKLTAQLLSRETPTAGPSVEPQPRVAQSERDSEAAAEHAGAVEPAPSGTEPSSVPVMPASEPAVTTHIQVSTDVHPDSE